MTVASSCDPRNHFSRPTYHAPNEASTFRPVAMSRVAVFAEAPTPPPRRAALWACGVFDASPGPETRTGGGWVT